MHQHEHSHSGQNIALALGLNLGFALIELVGGLWTGSLAILADSVHDAGDALALATAYVLERKSSQASDQKYSYGYKRFSLLGALINSIILLLGSAWVISAAITRLQDPSTPYAPGMVGIAILGLIVNTLGYFKLKNTHSLNQRLVSLHLLEDLFGWVVILVTSLTLLIWDLPYLDPLCSIFFSLIILIQVYKALKETLKILLMSTPAGINIRQIKEELCLHPHIIDIHDFHLWTLDGNDNVLTCHIVLDTALSDLQQQQLKIEIKEKARQFGIYHATLELESHLEECEQADCSP